MSSKNICFEKADVFSLGIMFIMLMSLEEIQLETEKDIRLCLKTGLNPKYPLLTRVIAKMVKFSVKDRLTFSGILDWTRSSGLDHYILGEIISSSTNLHLQQPKSVNQKLEDARRKSSNGFYKKAIRQFTEVFPEIQSQNVQTEVKLDIAKSFFRMGDLERGALLLQEIQLPVKDSGSNKETEFFIKLALEKIKLKLLRMEDPAILFDQVLKGIETILNPRYQYEYLLLLAWWLVNVKLEFQQAATKLKEIKEIKGINDSLEFGSIFISPKRLEFDLVCLQCRFKDLQSKETPSTYSSSGHVFFQKVANSFSLIDKITYYKTIGNFNFLLEVGGTQPKVNKGT